ESVDKHGRVVLVIDFFPIVFGGACVQALSENGDCQQRQYAQQGGQSLQHCVLLLSLPMGTAFLRTASFLHTTKFVVILCEAWPHWLSKVENRLNSAPASTQTTWDCTNWYCSLVLIAG